MLDGRTAEFISMPPEAKIHEHTQKQVRRLNECVRVSEQMELKLMSAKRNV